MEWKLERRSSEIIKILLDGMVLKIEFLGGN